MKGKRKSSWNEGTLLNLNIKEQITFELIPIIQCDDCVNVRLMNKDEHRRFSEKIQELNHIIEDDSILEAANEEWMNKTSLRHFGIFQPYVDKYTSALFSRGHLPSLLSKRKLLLIQDYINCESHLEKVKHVVNKS